MRRELVLDEIEINTPLTGDLENEAGDVVFAARTMLDKFDLIILKTLPGAKYFLAEPESSGEPDRGASADDERAMETATETPGESSERTIRVDSLRTGMQLTRSLYDADGVLLLAGGSRITDRFLVLLRQRSISVVQLRSDADAPPPKESSENPSEIEDGGDTGKWNRRLSVTDLFAEAQRGLELHVAASDLVEDMTGSTNHEVSLSGDKLRSVVDSFVDQLVLDHDLLLTVIGMKRTEGEYLFDHAVNVALLSMAIGARRGLEPYQIRELGLGALLQDAGMVALGDELRLAPREFTEEERRLLREHPTRTLAYLDRVKGLPAVTRFIGYQAHERADGSGYPRGRMLTTTHPYARIVGVADVFCAMTRPRPHRPAILPHQVIKEILQLGQQGKFDRDVIRSFLDTVSVFPIGSIVELSDGRPVRVIRTQAGFHTRPVVTEIGPDDQPTGNRIDLSKETGVSIVKELRYIQS